MNMKKTAEKLFLMLVTMFIVSLFVFAAFGALSGDPAERLLGTEATPEKLAALRAQLGIDRPFAVRYVSWLRDFAFGNMGTSYIYHMPVRTLLASKLPATALLTSLAFVLIAVVSIPLGILCGKYEGGFLDRVMTVCGQLVMAVPPFFTGILLSFIFGIVLKLFVVGNIPAWEDDLAGFAGYLFFPALAVALPRIAMTVKLLRGTILDEARQDYVRTSMSRGLSRTQILYRHVLKNAFVPVVTFLAVTVSEIAAGSVIIEQVFSVPGLGRLLLSSIANRDYPVVQAEVVLIALWVVAVNLLADILNARLDPRIQLQ